MRQVLFYIPLKTWLGLPWDIPIFGYGFMLFVAFIVCIWLACRLGRKVGIDSQHIMDLALWLFIPGVIGGRLVYILTELDYFLAHPIKVFDVREGGLVFYGSAIGGFVGFLFAYRRILVPNHISAWKMADVVAPCIAIGLCLGRIGCLLNGCCYGHVACPDCPGVSFPMSAPARTSLVHAGYQSAAGFTVAEVNVDGTRVEAVEPGSAAEAAGLQPGDLILKVNDETVPSYGALEELFVKHWPRNQGTLQLTVLRGREVVQLSPFEPYTLPLHPTQIYETISTGLLAFLLLAYWPFRRHDGELIVILMLAYAVHRFINETIRNDTAVYFDSLTLSQNISIALLLAGVTVGIYIWRQPPQYDKNGEPLEREAPGPEVEDVGKAEAAFQD